MLLPTPLLSLWGRSSCSTASRSRLDKLLLSTLRYIKPQLFHKTAAELARAQQAKQDLFPTIPSAEAVLLSLLGNLRKTVGFLAQPTPPIIVVIGEEHLLQALRQTPFVTLFGIHQGCWELLPLALTQRGHSPLVPYATPKSFSKAIDQLRQKSGADYFEAKNVLYQLKNARRTSDSKKIFALLVDQPGAQSNSKRNVHLFGSERCWWSTPLELTAKLGGALLPFSVEWKNAPIVTIYPRLEATLDRVAQESADWAEKQISLRPHEWVWFYSNQ